MYDGRASLLRWNLENVSGRATRQCPPGDIRRRVRSSKDLPPLPEISRRLLRLRCDPNASIPMLAGIIALDPLLATQIVRWANSAYYGLRDPVTTVHDAIVRSLGYDLALNLSLALATLNPLQTPNEGPIARDAVWHHGIKCSELMQALALRLPVETRPPPGLIALAGITQNIGYLLLGHLLPAQFRLVSQLIQANPTLTLTQIERVALGVDHTQLGFWLFDAWDMPSALRIVVRHHHHPRYVGEHEHLVWLTSLADLLLADSPWKLGAMPTDLDQQVLLKSLGIDPEHCHAALVSASDKTSD